MDINTRPTGAAFVRKSKFHLVDLAGSERIGKTGVHGQILNEAKYINLSLHYLEQVIITLQENPQGHVPYRNSKVTSVLRDSLGGNCKTTMIATANLDDEFAMESIATCKFAARVALIANDANINEHTDPKIVIAGLRQQIDMLKAELKATGKDPDEPDVPLSVDDLAMIAEMVRAYVTDRSGGATLALADMRKVREAFVVFKALVWEVKDSLLKKADVQQVDHLKALLATRDHELAVLVKLLRKMETGRPGEVIQAAEVPSSNSPYTKVYSPRVYAGDANAPSGVANNTNTLNRSSSDVTHALYHSSSASSVPRVASADVLAKRQHIANIIREAEEEDENDIRIGKSLQIDMTKHLITAQSKQPLLMQNDNRPQSPHLTQQNLHPSHNQLPQTQHQPAPSKKEAFEKFKYQHPDYAASQANHTILKEKYDVAKDYSAHITQARDKINGYIALIEQLRVERAMQALTSKEQENDKDKDKKDLEEERTKALIEKEKLKYKDYCEKLQHVKLEIDTLQAMIKNTNTSIQKDFMSWYRAVYGSASHISPSPIPTVSSPILASSTSHSPRSSPRSTTVPTNTSRSHPSSHSSHPSSPLVSQSPSHPSSPIPFLKHY